MINTDYHSQIITVVNFWVHRGTERGGCKISTLSFFLLLGMKILPCVTSKQILLNVLDINPRGRDGGVTEARNPRGSSCYVTCDGKYVHCLSRTNDLEDMYECMAAKQDCVKTCWFFKLWSPILVHIIFFSFSSLVKYYMMMQS